MEPHRERPNVPEPRPREQPKRFRIVKLEERIAPKGSTGTLACGSNMPGCNNLSHPPGHCK